MPWEACQDAWNHGLQEVAEAENLVTSAKTLQLDQGWIFQQNAYVQIHTKMVQ